MSEALITTFGTARTAVLNEVANGLTTDQDRVGEFIQRIYRKCISRILELNENYYLTSTTIATVASTQTYDWNDDLSITDLMKPIALHDENGEPIEVGSIRHDIEEIFWIGNRGYGWTTAPDSATDYILWYIARPDDLTSASDVPAIEKVHFEILFYGGCYLYYMWKKDTEMATFYKSQFNEMWEDFVNFHATNLTGTERMQVVSDGCE